MTQAPGVAAIRSLGLRSDVLVLRGLSAVEVHSDRVVVRTPAEPDFWFGNMVIFRTDRADPDEQVARFKADFPESGHVTLAWDAPDMPSGTGLDALADQGFDVEWTDVLSLIGPLNRSPVPKGIDLRPIQTDAEWEQAISLQLEVAVEEGYSAEGHEAYLRRRFAGRRRQVGEGWATWLGAFDGDLLVGDLGMFVGEGTARFQSVETRSSHRRRGICAALVCAGVDWAAARDPAAVPVIVALAESPAGRIYRSCGFTLAERLVSALRPPAGARLRHGEP